MNTASHSNPKARFTFDAALNFIERVGNRLPDPITIFFLLAIIALIASWIASAFGAAVIHPVSGERILAVNLLSRTGLRQVFTQMVDNFTEFRPLGVVLVAMIGIGVAEKTGLFGALLKSLVTAVPAKAITPTVIFAGIMSNVAADAGYVILVPLAAMLYAALGRHPIAGIAAVFAGIGGGFSANLLVTSLDPLLAGLTTEAAQLMEPKYEVNATASYFFMAASVALLVVVGTWVSNRMVEPRLGPYQGQAAVNELNRPTAQEKRGMIAAGISSIVVLLLFALMAIPAWGPLHADGLASNSPWIDRLKPFFDSLVGLLAIFFAVPGLVYGVVTRSVSSDRDAARMMSETMSAMGAYIVMAFFAGQFIAYFNWSNLGLIIAISGADLLKQIQFQGVWLMVAFVFVAATINLFMASASAKWAIMAPVFVPMFMALGWSPEATQGLYRVGDSITNVVTPLNYYLPIILAAANRYVPNVRLGAILSAMAPYSIAFGIAWTIMIVLWLSLGLPLGPGAPLHYAAG